VPEALDERHLASMLAPQPLEPARELGRVTHLTQINQQIHRDVVARRLLLGNARCDLCPRRFAFSSQPD